MMSPLSLRTYYMKMSSGETRYSLPYPSLNEQLQVKILGKGGCHKHIFILANVTDLRLNYK